MGKRKRGMDRKEKPKQEKKYKGAMLGAYCTNKQCDLLDIHRIVRPGSRCKCGYPLSWLGKAISDNNKYADGAVNSGSVDRWK